jgi:uncharacterized protein (TIGR02444 family)
MKEAEDLAALPLEGPHWSFALTLYARPGVAEACLLLQHRAGVDVNILLFALYAATERGVGLTVRELEDMDGAVAAWRRDIIHPLRSIRRRLKTGPLPAPSTTTEALRSEIKASELRAERIEQAILMQWLGQRAGHATDRATEPGAVIEGVVTYYANQSRTRSPHSAEIRGAMETLLAQSTVQPAPIPQVGS